MAGRESKMALGSTDMSSGNGNGFDPMASWARLSERVENQGKDIVDLRSNMNTGFQTINSAIGSLSNDFRANSKTQWPVIWSAAGVCMAALLAAGSFFYGTLTKGQDKLDSQISVTNQLVNESISKLAATTQTSITAILDKMVTQNEMKWRTDRALEDRKRVDDTISDVKDKQIPREEVVRIQADLQRQLDEVKSDIRDMDREHSKPAS